MNIQLNIYNNKMSKEWTDRANEMEAEIFFMVSKSVRPPFDAHLHCHTDRPLSDVIDTLEMVLHELKKRNSGNTGLIKF